MTKHREEMSDTSAGPSPPAQTMALDMQALDNARRSLEQGAVAPSYGPWREDIVRLLNDTLATVLVCLLRYRRHHFMAQGVASSEIAAEFLVHANEEAAHADRIAQRIVQLGGEPDFSPDSLTKRSHADYDEASDPKSMLRANLPQQALTARHSRPRPGRRAAN